MKKIIINIHLIFALAATSVFAQQQVSGIVKDANTLREISSVNVFVKGTQKGTITNSAGKYNLPLRGIEQKAVVVFRHVSYSIKEIPLDSLLDNPDVFLEPRVIPLQGVEIVGESGRPVIDIAKDLPVKVDVIEAKEFELRGYVDAARPAASRTMRP